MDDLEARLQAEADSFRAASVKVEGDSYAADLLIEALSRITELEGILAAQGKPHDPCGMGSSSLDAGRNGGGGEP